jgi:hypothetical protein
MVVLDDDHVEPVDSWAVDHYERLLVAHPDQDTDLLLVLVDNQGRKHGRRGRHRLLANLRAKRSYVLAMVYNERPQP